MEVRSSRRVRTLVTQMARSGLSTNEIALALIPMMARSKTLQSKAGYIDARPLPPYPRNSLATHGRTIHLGQKRHSWFRYTSKGDICGRSLPKADIKAHMIHVGQVPCMDSARRAFLLHAVATTAFT